jgi:hypothetical protein
MIIDWSSVFGILGFGLFVYGGAISSASSGGTGPTHFRVDVEAIGAGAIDHVDIEEL